MNPARDGVAAVVADADAALRAGNALQCFELVERAIARGIRDPDLDYRAVLALAHCGNAQQALDRYHRTAHPQPDQDWLALEGRLFKDLAQQDSAAAGFMYARAAQAYWQAFQKTGGYFSAVNAATTFLLAGDTSRAEAIARDVLAMTQSADSRDPLEQYNVLVTHAEAALLLGEHERCRESLRRADTLVPDHRSARARTVHQLRLIGRQRRCPKDIVGLLRVPPQAWVLADALATPNPERLLEQHLRQLAPPPLRLDGAMVHLAVLAPSDLWVAVYLQLHGAHVHAALPGNRETMMTRWQERHGAAWTMRLAQTLANTNETSFVTGYLDREPQWERRGLLARSLGLSRLMPTPLRSDWLALQARPAADGFAIDAPDAGRLREEERSLLDPQVPLSEEPRMPGVRERRLVAVLEARLNGIDTLADADHPRCWTRVVGGFAEAFDPADTRLIERRRLGNSLRFIGMDARALTQLAHRLHASLVDVQGEQSSFAGLGLQTLLHFGPVYVGDDPVESRPAAFGSELLRAGRLATQVPAGLVLATEAFAARLVQESADEAPTYAGDVPLDNARVRLFSLAPSRRPAR
ncbi:MAG: tetratricopeptide repeat-containing protein [Sinimarinibacterium flocculans]|uniref:tetratricopeptide repeat-containing protein n=1 Tax=Sinimarinibacterium flocculans TaxID=985250 RepID=UPI003C46841E